MLKHSSSNQAASALYLSMKILPRYFSHHYNHKEGAQNDQFQQENDENKNSANIMQ